MNFIRTTITQLERIKARARELRPQFDRLGHARDVAAKEAGYQDYHHAHQCARMTAEQEARRLQQPDGMSAPLVSYALEHFSDVLRYDAAVDLRAPGLQDSFSKSIGLEYMFDEVFAVQVDGGPGYFRNAVNDYRAHLREAGFSVPDDYLVKNQMEVAIDIWASLHDQQFKPQCKQLFFLAALRQWAGFASFLATATNESMLALQTTERLMDTIEGLLQADSPFPAETAIAAADELMPREMNRNLYTGEPDYSHPSTYWSRTSAQASYEMAGYVASLPLGTLEKLRLQGSDCRQMPLFALAVPLDPETRHRMTAQLQSNWAVRHL